jgi:hypothetical protein
MRLRLTLFSLLSLSVALADTLTLRNGKTVHGSYLGGNSRQIRMAVDDNVQTFDVTEVATLQFDSGPAPTAQAQPAPEQPAVAPTASTERRGEATSMHNEAAAAQAPAAREERKVLIQGNAPPSPARTAPAAAVTEIPSGTNITIRMIDDVDSTQARIGQTFRASIDEPVVVNGRDVIPRGADVVTKIVELKDPSKLSGGGQLTLDLASITINGKPVEVSSQSVSTAGESRTGQSAKVIGGTAALGAIIGAIAGGGKGAAIGAASGAGAGTAVQVLTQGTRIRIPSETRLTFTLQQPVKL